MKICYLADINSAHTHKFLNYFKKKGYEIDVISLGDGEYEGVNVHCLNVNDSVMKNSSDGGKLEYLKKIKRVKKLIKEINPDIVHAHYATSYGLLGALAGAHPYIISVWGSDVYEFPLKSSVHKMILKHNLKKADCILSTSNVMKEVTQQYTAKQIKVTPFGVDTEKFKPEASKEKDEKELVIGTIKTLEEKYGIQYLVKAFIKVCRKYPDMNLKLKIGGKGSQLEYLENLCAEAGIKDKVEFLGFLNQDEVIKTFQNMDIAVYPSTLDSESFGVAAVEAESCGIPVIVSEIPGLMESTKPGFTSLVCEKKNPDDLAEKIEKLINDKKLREEMGKNAREFVLENYDLNDNFNDIDKIYKEIIRK